MRYNLFDEVCILDIYLNNSVHHTYQLDRRMQKSIILAQVIKCCSTVNNESTSRLFMPSIQNVASTEISPELSARKSKKKGSKDGSFFSNSLLKM